MIPRLKFKCPVCGKLTAGRIPKGGDGSFYYPRRHNFGASPCPGNIQEAEWVDYDTGKMREMTTIHVTEEDIAKGKQGKRCGCPISIAIHRQTKWRDAAVASFSVFEDEHIFRKPRTIPSKTRDLPEEAIEFIRQFDAGMTVSPFNFEIDIPSATE